MARDFAINSSLQTTWNEVGDITDVTGENQIEQSIVIDIIENVGLGAPALTDTAIEQKRGDIEQAVRGNDMTEPPIQVIVNEINPEEEYIIFDIGTNHVSLSLTVEQ